MTRQPGRTGVDRDAQVDLPLPPSTLVGLIIAIVAIALIAFVTYQALRAREAAAARVTSTLEIIQQLEAVRSSLTDAETGQRGYLLTGEERYLEPFNEARGSLPGEIAQLKMLMQGAGSRKTLEMIEELANQKLDELGDTIAMRRAGNTTAALDVVRTDRGQALMERIRAAIDEAKVSERTSVDAYQREFDRAVTLSTWATWGGAGTLAILLSLAASVMSRDFRARETQAWIRTGQMGLANRLQGEQRLETLGDHALTFLADYVDAQVGAAFVVHRDGSFRRVATFAMPADDRSDTITPGHSLAGQAVKENRTLHVRDVPDGYLTVSSSLGRGKPRELLVAPGSVDGVVHAVIELGFFHKVLPRQLELLDRVSESLGVAVRTSKDRTRLEELLWETQRQAEELQTQQEELRVSNEELEEQSRVLRESQSRLETQQTELEQINTQLEEQTQILEMQKQDASDARNDLLEKAAELERANRYKSEFLANMSHELRTPLNSSLILAKLLADNKDGNLTEEQVKFAQTIGSAGNDLLALINDILDLSKIEAGKVDLSIESVRIARSVQAVARDMQPLAEQKGLAFDVVVEPGTPERIETDAQRLGQILKNLLSNAVKFTDKGEIALRVYSPGEGQVAFAVKDTGIGIPAQQQSIIFEAFRQADGSTHRKYGGTGLGLSISRDLAHLLGGDITVQSGYGQGSVFTVTLPVAYTADMPPREPPPVVRAGADVSDPPAAAAVQPAVVVPGHQHLVLARPTFDDDRDRLSPASRRILIVEDDPRFAAVLGDLAHEMGFQFVCVHSASDGLAAASMFHPNAILLDINLPDYSGLGVLDQLKRTPETRHIPVHVISVADYTHQALERGAVGYAMKPVRREQLVDAFKKLEARLTPGVRRVLVVEDDIRQRESIQQLLSSEDVQITGVGSAHEALAQLKATTFDCVVMDLKLPDLSGYQLLEKMAEQEDVSFPPVIVYTGRTLTRDEEQQLGRFSRSIIIKDARSPERLLDQVTLFLHQVESSLPVDRQRMLKAARDRDAAFEGRRILIVEDDARNIFALSSVLEPKGAKIEIARNGKEALELLTRSAAASGNGVDLVLMDIMMPEMDGLTAMREIRRRAEWKKLPIIALTAKAMRDDQEKCLAAGANDYIAKPLDVEKLLSLVRVWMPKAEPGW
jgi:CheY-like chemotaxis protein/signal transduction histidine kinase/CHASE3 domain sensor protein